MDVFAWHKAVEGIGRSYKSLKPINDGRQLLVHFDNKIYSDNLLRADKVIDIPVKVTPHRALNSSRCVIGCKEVQNMDEEDIKDKLQSQGVTKVERIVQTYPIKVGIWFVAQKFTFQIHNVLIVRNTATTKDSARTNQNVLNVDRLDMTIMNVKT